MLREIATTVILGKPLMLYFGILTFLLLLSTALIGYLNFKGNSIIPFKWHPRIAVTTIIIAIIHAILVISVYLG